MADNAPALVLDGVSLTSEPGCRHLLLGPSGSGKTTLIHAICGLLTPNRGRVLVAGEDMGGAAPVRRDAIRRRIGVVFQSLRLVSALSLRANLELARDLAGRPRDAARVPDVRGGPAPSRTPSLCRASARKL